MASWLQWALVAAIEVVAVGYLAFRFTGPRKKPKVLEKPDVPASSLVRSKRRAAPEEPRTPS